MAEYCGCTTVCYDQEFPGLPPDGICRRARECGCKKECFHRAHPNLPRYRVCTREPLAMGIGVHRIVKLTQNSEYGKGMQMEPMQPMDAVSKYPTGTIADQVGTALRESAAEINSVLEESGDSGGISAQSITLLKKAYHTCHHAADALDIPTVEGDMIPRVTLRDASDAILIIQALRAYQLGRSDELQQEARRPGADQIALSLIHINETQYIIDLMTAITDGIVSVTTETKEN
jgi:hypothetical protein